MILESIITGLQGDGVTNSSGPCVRLYAVQGSQDDWLEPHVANAPFLVRSCHPTLQEPASLCDAWPVVLAQQVGWDKHTHRIRANMTMSS